MADGIFSMPPGVLTQDQGTQLMGVGNQMARDQALNAGLMSAGAGLLAAPNLREGLAAGLTGFNRAYDTELLANRPKVTPLANGAFSQISFPDGRVEVVSNDQVQGFIRSQEELKQGQKAAPKGYVWNPAGTGLVPIPGGPADEKVIAREEAAQLAYTKAKSRYDVVTTNLKKAWDQTDWTSAGFLGQFFRNIGGTGAADLKSVIDTVKANIGFDELQAMRQASPTGGALGQVAVQELNMLQAVLGNLDSIQSPAQLKDQLDAVFKQYNKAYKAVVANYEQRAANQGIPENAPVIRPGAQQPARTGGGSAAPASSEFSKSAKYFEL